MIGLVVNFNLIGFFYVNIVEVLSIVVVVVGFLGYVNFAGVVVFLVVLSGFIGNDLVVIIFVFNILVSYGYNFNILGLGFS